LRVEGASPESVKPTPAAFIHGGCHIRYLSLPTYHYARPQRPGQRSLADVTISNVLEQTWTARSLADVTISNVLEQTWTARSLADVTISNVLEQTWTARSLADVSMSSFSFMLLFWLALTCYVTISNVLGGSFSFMLLFWLALFTRCS